jgi:hypothetical protein
MILNIASIVIAVALVVVTYLYMRHTKRLADDTKRMADALVKDYELRVRPILDFDVGSRMSSAEGITVYFKFFNAGEIPIKLNHLIFTWWFKSHPQMQHSISKDLNRTIYKRERWEHKIQFGEHEFRQHEPEGTKSLKPYDFYKHVSGIFRIEYFDVYDKLEYKESQIQSLMS